jgi:carboxyl-terminal processing protease
MIQHLDPHSSYLNEEEFKELRTETKETFGGAGIEITIKDGVLTVVAPIEDGPASKAGLEPGDKIVKIDGDSTKNITLLQAVKKMRGPVGSTVTFTIMRAGFAKPRDFPIPRQQVWVRSVKKQLLEPGYPYIRLLNFQEDAQAEVIKAIREMGDEQGIKGLILDLRNNPGGLFDQAVKVAGLFIEDGLIVYTDGRTKEQCMEFRADKSKKHYGFRLAVLINEGSAAASEIVTGAMQDHDRALVFGATSFGKASVQTVIPLEDGSGLRLTTARYFTPKGRNIEKSGIQPDVDLRKEMDEQSRAPGKEQPNSKTQVAPAQDVVVKRALEWLKSSATVSQFKAGSK